jgi:hypothetical protein
MKILGKIIAHLALQFAKKVYNLYLSLSMQKHVVHYRGMNVIFFHYDKECLAMNNMSIHTAFTSKKKCF